jgi:protein-S-isoprenylcysteine O-methyltransferase Ste14
MEAWKHVQAVLLLPFVVTLEIPATLLYPSGTDTFNLWQSVPAMCVAALLVGGLLICLGLTLMVAKIRLFVTVGMGTLAPWNPPQRLVVQGAYRQVRNPMICGVFAILLGEAVLAASLPLLAWFIVVNAVYIPLVEEPSLVKRFGHDHRTYKQNVPRWLPMFRAWPGEPSDQDRMPS